MLGVALTEAQMRLLTTDMVWLVAQNVTLPDGTTERVLMPQVYVRVAEGDLRTDGTLMAGSSVTMQLQGDLTNSGAILGRQVSDIRAENIGNSGRIASAGLTELTARQDITSSGAIDGNEIKLRAERDVNLTTQTSSSTGPNASRTAVDRVASVNATQLLQVTAGRDITLAGTHVSSGGTLTLDAARDLILLVSRRRAFALAGVTLVLLDPFVQGLRRAANLGGHRLDGRPQRMAFAACLEHHAHCALSYFC